MEERLFQLTPDEANVVRRLGATPKALARSMIAAAERDPSRHPELGNLLVALRLANKDPIAHLVFGFAGGKPTLRLREGTIL